MDLSSDPVSAGSLRKMVIKPEEIVYIGFIAGKRQISIAVTLRNYLIEYCSARELPDYRIYLSAFSAKFYESSC